MVKKKKIAIIIIIIIIIIIKCSYSIGLTLFTPRGWRVANEV